MNDELTTSRTGPQTGLAALGIAAFAVICCAGLPLLAGLLGAVALGGMLGVGVGALTLAVFSVLIVARRRRQGACAQRDVAMRRGGES